MGRKGGRRKAWAGEERSELSGGSRELSLSPPLQTLPSPCFHWVSRLPYLPGQVCTHCRILPRWMDGWMLAVASGRRPLTDQCVAGHPPTHTHMEFFYAVYPTSPHFHAMPNSDTTDDGAKGEKSKQP